MSVTEITFVKSIGSQLKKPLVQPLGIPFELTNEHAVSITVICQVPPEFSPAKTLNPPAP